MKLPAAIAWRLWGLSCEEIIDVVQQVMHIESKGVGEPVEHKWRGPQSRRGGICQCRMCCPSECPAMASQTEPRDIIGMHCVDRLWTTGPLCHAGAAAEPQLQSCNNNNNNSSHIWSGFAPALELALFRRLDLTLD